MNFSLTDTGEDSKIVHTRIWPKVDASIFFFFPTRPNSFKTLHIFWTRLENLEGCNAEADKYFCYLSD